MNNIINRIFEEGLSLKYHLEKSEIIDFIKQVMLSNNISKEDLKASLLILISDNEFDLVSYAFEKDFIHHKEGYTRKDVILELKIYLWSYLYPNNELSIEERHLIYKLVQNILEKYYRFNKWMPLSDLNTIISVFTGKDFYDVQNFLQKLFFEGKVEFKNYEGEDANGFKHYNSRVRWISN